MRGEARTGVLQKAVMPSILHCQADSLDRVAVRSPVVCMLPKQVAWARRSSNQASPDIETPKPSKDKVKSSK